MTGGPAADTIAAVFRSEFGRAVAILARVLGDVSDAEDAVQDAYAQAVRRWPETGIPDNPAGWIVTVARNRAIDRLRRERAMDERRAELARQATERLMTDPVFDSTDEIPDERLRLICTCCHPALSHEASVALTLRLVAGLQTREIARLFLVGEATMAARITRAKRKIAASGIPFRVPDRVDLPDRLARICSVVYLLFTEGYAATIGPDLVRTRLCDEAIRLQRVVAELIPTSAEAEGLLALMILQHARRDARIDDGRLVRLSEQDRSRWHRAEIDTGLQRLNDAVTKTDTPGSYLLQAAIAAEHMRAPTAAETDWAGIATLYVRLDRLTGSPVVRLNRAVAVAEAEGPAAGLALLDGLDEELSRHHRLPATRAELLRRLGDREAALEQYDRALERVGTDTERAYLTARRDELTGG